MTEPHSPHTIPDSVARPPTEHSQWEIADGKRLLAFAGELVSEADSLESALTDPDAAAALARLRERMARPGFESRWPMLRACAMQHLGTIVDLDKEVDAGVHECLTRQAGYAEAAFRAAPGEWLPGATRTPIRLLRSAVAGVVHYQGEPTPWVTCVPGAVREAVDILAEAVDRGFSAGILVGMPDCETEIALPDWVTFVTMQVTRRDGVPDGSERGPGGNGGGRIA